LQLFSTVSLCSFSITADILCAKPRDVLIGLGEIAKVSPKRIEKSARRQAEIAMKRKISVNTRKQAGTSLLSLRSHAREWTKQPAPAE
jgi:hypothetical protein